MSEKPKKERGYKEVTDPEELKRKLAQWQQRQLTLQARRNKLGNILAEIDHRLKRTTTYVENIGRTLSLYKTYNNCWYTRDRNYTQMVFLQQFVAPPENVSEDRRMMGPEKAVCINFRASTMSRGKVAFAQVGSTTIEMIRFSEQPKPIRYYKCHRSVETVRNIGTIVPDLELLTVFGNRELPRLLEVLAPIPEKDWPINEDHYSSASTEKLFFMHPTTNVLCEVLIYDTD